MKKRRKFPTSIQNIALELVFEVMGEERINRSREEYMEIAAKLPPLKQLVFTINKRLKQLHKEFSEQSSTQVIRWTGVPRRS
jgi:hypothetical protein